VTRSAMPLVHAGAPEQSEGASRGLRLVGGLPRRRRLRWRRILVVGTVAGALGSIAGNVVAQRLAIEVDGVQQALRAAEIRHADLVAEVSLLASPAHVEAVAGAHGFVHPTWQEVAASPGGPTPQAALGAPVGESAPLPAGTVQRG